MSQRPSPRLETDLPGPRRTRGQLCLRKIMPGTFTLFPCSTLSILGCFVSSVSMPFLRFASHFEKRFSRPALRGCHSTSRSSWQRVGRHVPARQGPAREKWQSPFLRDLRQRLQGAGSRAKAVREVHARPPPGQPARALGPAAVTSSSRPTQGKLPVYFHLPRVYFPVPQFRSKVL